VVDEKFYSNECVVSGLGDAGDLSFGVKS